MGIVAYTRDGRVKSAGGAQFAAAEFAGLTSEASPVSVRWDQTVFNTDPAAIYLQGTPARQVVVRDAGYYTVTYNVLQGTGGMTDGRYDSQIYRNGSSVRQAMTRVSGGYAHHKWAGTIWLNAGDYIEVKIGTAGGNTYPNDPGWSHMSITKQGGIATPVAQEGWTFVGAPGQPAYQNGWAAYGAGVAFFKDTAGIVHLRGEAVAGTWTSGTTIFTLPVGYRPGDRYYFPVMMNASPYVGTLQVQSSGAVVTDQRAGTATHVHGFGAIHFRAEA